ncbi:acyl-CoA thioesterase [Paracoccus sp. (in: a-proteobacteria)]|uniref:acyl-CoA thioesterase n=1 Tax=Paracoccus sp. TaxID=267 RepID=UPI003A8470B1
MTEQSAGAKRLRPLSSADLPPAMWSAGITVRHGNCDPAGIVYTPEFFHFFNQAIEAWFCDCLGIDYYDMLGRRRVGLGYAEAASAFFTPCMVGEKLMIHVAVEHVGTKSYSLVLHALKDGTEALRGRFTTVTTSLDTHRAIPIPEDLKAALSNYAARARMPDGQ